MTSPRFASAITLLAALILTACSAGEEAAPLPPRTEATAPAVEASSPPVPSESPSPVGARPTAPPAQSLAAGTVAEGSSAGISGEGSAEITFVRGGEFAVVIALDCAECVGPTVITAPGRMSPYGESEGSLQGSYLADVFEGSEPEQSLWLVADGAWTLEMSSWNDLPPQTGVVKGEGSQVLLLAGESPSSLVTWEPATASDSFQGRYFGSSRVDALTFGDTAAFSEGFEMQRPGVIAITTDGTWSIEP